jgi:hypothetical protein
MNQKYVVFDDQFAVCFDSKQVHAGLGYCDQYTNPHDWKRSRPTSAGFFQLAVRDGNVVAHVYGESESLRLKSKPSDSDLIAKALGII